MSNDQFTIHHLPDQQKYSLVDTETTGGNGDPLEIGLEAYLDVTTVDGTERVLYHTLVSEDYGGRGLASILVQRVVDDAVAAGLTIVPVCPYVAKWLEKNEQYLPRVQKPTPAHLEAVRADTQS